MNNNLIFDGEQVRFTLKGPSTCAEFIVAVAAAILRDVGQSREPLQLAPGEWKAKVHMRFDFEAVQQPASGPLKGEVHEVRD